MASSSDSFSWLVAESLTMFFAMLGGMLVFGGLWKEKKAIKELYSNVDDFRSQKAKGELGWKMLMVGIAIETLVAGVFAARDGWEIRQIRINEDQNAPLNQPVSDFSAIVTISMQGTNFNELPSQDLTRDTFADFSGNGINSFGWTLAGFGGLQANEVRRFTNWEFGSHKVNYHGYVLKFQKDPFPPFGSENEFGAKAAVRPTVKQILGKIEVLRIHISFIPNDAEVIGGTAELLVNGSFRKKFEIHRQNTDKDFSAWNPIIPGFTLIATNSIP